ncbi:F0F1 ATP synthase subunit A [Planctomycetales bacterium ZRK34]|nr:F0F1 ATP synthase subunit A [Planctomycetales bacterium ZRK34]
MTMWLTTLAASSPVAHVIDHPWFGDGSEPSHWLMSNAIFMMIIATVLTALLIIPAAKKIATRGSGENIDDFRAQGINANFVEAICVYLREEVFRPIFHDDVDKYMPVLWTFFWFILMCNLLGLVPLVDLTGGLLAPFGIEINHGHGIGGTATQSIWVTGALAFCAFITINVTGILKDPVGYFKHLMGGVPFSLPMVPIIAIIMIVEFIGIFVKPFALAVRLFANMSGGHILLAVLFSFVPLLIRNLGGIGYGMALLPLLGAIAIYMLEVLVALIQAFIFTFLTGLFLGQLVHHDHEEEHGPEDYEEKPGLESGPLA